MKTFQNVYLTLLTLLLTSTFTIAPVSAGPITNYPIPIPESNNTPPPPETQPDLYGLEAGDALEGDAWEQDDMYEPIYIRIHFPDISKTYAKLGKVKGKIYISASGPMGAPDLPDESFTYDDSAPIEGTSYRRIKIISTLKLGQIITVEVKLYTEDSAGNPNYITTGTFRGWVDTNTTKSSLDLYIGEYF